MREAARIDLATDPPGSRRKNIPRTVTAAISKISRGRSQKMADVSFGGLIHPIQKAKERAIIGMAAQPKIRIASSDVIVILTTLQVATIKPRRSAQPPAASIDAWMELP